MLTLEFRGQRGKILSYFLNCCILIQMGHQRSGTRLFLLVTSIDIILK